MIHFRCPGCHVEVKAKPKRAGTHGRCPKCGSDFTIPDPNRTEVDEAESMAEPYGLKGDRVGMSLAEFKTKHHRKVVRTPGGRERIAPKCTKQSAAGLVSCKLAFWFEESQGRASPTVAGVPTTNLSYHFVDERLYKISAGFDAKHAASVRDAMTLKYGEPSTPDRTTSLWGNEVSMIVLGQSKQASQPAVLLFIHNDLSKLAENRQPGPSVDDL